MTCNVPPFARWVLTEASQISPRRRTSSDGVCADARHYQTGGDHVPSGPNNYAHAVDVSHSIPGAPFWNPGYGQFDAMAYGRAVAQRMAQGIEKRVTYLVANFGGADQIFHPASHGNLWVQNGSYKTDHRSHLHISFTVTAEQSVAPFFTVAQPVPAPKPTPPPPPVTIPIPEDDVQQTDISMTLDGQGNGYVDLPGVKAVAVRSVLSIGIPDPQTAHGYAPIPRVSLTISPPPSSVARVVVEGGKANGPASVRVVHA